MFYKRYYSIALALLITTNSTAMGRRAYPPIVFSPLIVFSAFITTIAVIVVGSKIRSWLAAYFYSKNIISSGDVRIDQSSGKKLRIVKNELIINDDNQSDKLPLISPLGTTVTTRFDLPVQDIQVPHWIAHVYIDDTEEPRIEYDTAFLEHLTFNVKNGILTATTPDNQPRKFEHTEKPLCTIYAKLLTTTFSASNNAKVDIENQKVDTITSTNFSEITGSVQPIDNLQLSCSNNAQLALNGIQCHNLKMEVSNFATTTITGSVDNDQEITIKNNSTYTSDYKNSCKKIKLSAHHFATIKHTGDCQDFEAHASSNSEIIPTGMVTNRKIIASNFSTFNGSSFIGQDGELDANASNNSKIFAVGTVKHQKVTASNFSTFNGSNSETADVSINNNSEVKFGALKKLTGSAHNFSTIRYQEPVIIKVQLDNTSKLLKQ